MIERTAADGFHLLDAMMAWGGEIPPEDFEKIKANVIDKAEETGIPVLDAIDVAIYTASRELKRLVGIRITSHPGAMPGVTPADIDTMLDR